MSKRREPALEILPPDPKTGAPARVADRKAGTEIDVGTAAAMLRDHARKVVLEAERDRRRPPLPRKPSHRGPWPSDAERQRQLSTLMDVLRVLHAAHPTWREPATVAAIEVELKTRTDHRFSLSTMYRALKWAGGDFAPVRIEDLWQVILEERRGSRRPTP